MQILSQLMESLRSLAPRTVYDIGQILKSMADEFLVHISQDGDYIEGLHPVRSRHIVEYLHEYYPLEVGDGD